VSRGMRAAVLALSLYACGPAEVPEPECVEYQTIVEIPFTKAGGWEIDSRLFNTPPHEDGCFVQQPPCPEDVGNHYMLGRMRFLRRTVDVPPQSNIDRVIMQGNAYTRGVTLEFVLEDYEPEWFRVDEPDDCSLDVMMVEYWKKSDYHPIAADGSIYLNVSLADIADTYGLPQGCGKWAPEMPTCSYSYKNYYDKLLEGEAIGCIGLSKILLQQCVRKKVYEEE